MRVPVRSRIRAGRQPGRVRERRPVAKYGLELECSNERPDPGADLAMKDLPRGSSEARSRSEFGARVGVDEEDGGAAAEGAVMDEPA